MSFNVNGHQFARVRSISCVGEPAVGFSRLLFGLELAIRERRCVGLPTVRELLGDLFVQGDGGDRHFLGRLQATNAPLDISVLEAQTSVSLDVELDRARLDALETIRCGRDVTFELSLRGRVHIGDECHRVSDTETHRVSREDWGAILERLGSLAPQWE